jgi:3-oxoacyl-(acyl-carrier-protein) synthase
MMASVGRTAVDRSADDDGNSVAVVAMACRYPQADSPEALWELLARGGDAIGVVDRHRWRPVQEPEPKDEPEDEVEFLGCSSSSSAAAAAAAPAVKIKVEGGGAASSSASATGSSGGGSSSGKAKAKASGRGTRRQQERQQQQQQQHQQKKKRSRDDGGGMSMADRLVEESLPRVVAASLAEPEAWDPDHFDFTDGEAAAMDPQHRLALEVAAQTFHRAGYKREALKGQRVGVWVAMSNPEWGELPAGRAACVGAAALVEGAPPAAAHAAQRISQFYRLKGPSLVVNSGCSSSLAAVDQAATALRQGRCTAALVVGVHMLLGPRSVEGWRQVGLLSASGEGAVFAPNADGFVLGEGAGAVLLEPAAQARARGHTTLLGMLRATSVAYGGSPFHYHPGELRAELLELMGAARAEAGLPKPAAGSNGDGDGSSPRLLVDYAEISGAGRTVFDAREAACLAAVYGGGLSSPNPSQETGGGADGEAEMAVEAAAAAAAAAAPAAAGGAPGEGLVVGCVKASLGHMDAGSGMAGLIKALLVLQHRAAPPQPRLPQGPHQEFLSLGVTVPAAGRLVPIGGGQGAGVGGAAAARPLRVAVTSLAWSGTNAHVLVEECADDGVECMLAHDDEGGLRREKLGDLEMNRRPFPWWHVEHAFQPEPEEEDDDEEEEEEEDGALSQDSEATQQPRAPKFVSCAQLECGCLPVYCMSKKWPGWTGGKSGKG